MDEQSCDASCQATVHWLDEKIVKLILVRLRFNVEKAIEKVFKWEAQGLSGKVSDNIYPVSSPQGNDAFLLDASVQTVNDSCVLDCKSGIFNLGLH